MPSFDFEIDTTDGFASGTSSAGTDPSQAYGLQQNTGVVDLAVERLLEQFCEKPLIEALVRPVARQMQQLEDAIWTLMFARNIDTATGAMLEDIGDLVDLPRNALSDSDYRAAIILRAFQLRAFGTSKNMFTLAQLQLGDGYNIEVLTDHSATFTFEVQEQVTQVQADRLHSLIAQSVPAGVYYSTVFFISDPAGIFKFSSDLGAITSGSSQGFADATQNGGGKLAGVMAG